MKCPKCGYISFDFNEKCPKCSRDLKEIRDKLILFPFEPSPVNWLEEDEVAGPVFEEEREIELEQVDLRSLGEKKEEKEEEIELEPIGLESLEKEMEKKEEEGEIELEPVELEGLEIEVEEKEK